MAYNNTNTSTYAGGSYGEYDEDVEVQVEDINMSTEIVKPKSKVLIWGALIAAALLLFN